MRTIFRNFVAIVVMVGIIYAVTNYSGLIKEQVGVKGTQTDRAQEISGEISSDIGKQVESVKDNAMQINLQDVTEYFTRFQKIPQDVTDAKDYVQEQVTNVMKAREEQKQ